MPRKAQQVLLLFSQHFDVTRIRNFSTWQYFFADKPITQLGRYASNSSTGVNGYRHLSRSAQNLNTIHSDSNADNAFQSLPVKRSFIKNVVKTKNAPYSLKNNAEITIAIDIGTTFSGFAYTIENAPSSNVHIMRSVKGT